MKKILFLISIIAVFINLTGIQGICAEKESTPKAVQAVKSATNKTVKATKKGYNKTVDGTKNVIDNLNPNKPVTLSELETKAEIRTLKNEKKGIKSAYNSRIKDINAKIKAAEASTTLSETQKQNKIYTLTKEKDELISKRDAAIFKYDSRIKELKAKQ